MAVTFPSVTSAADLRRRLKHTKQAGWVIPASVPPSVREEMLDAIATEGASDPLVAEVARRSVAYAQGAADHALTAIEQLQALLETLHSLTVYVPDPTGPDPEAPADLFLRARTTLTPREGHPLSPTSHAPRGGGDCDDLASAFAALARAVGLPAVPKWLDQPGSTQNHVAVVSCGLGPVAWRPPGPAGNPDPGVDCLWVEPTVPGAIVGEDPYEAVRNHGGAAQVYGAAGLALAPARDLLAGKPGAARVVVRDAAVRAVLVGAGVYGVNRVAALGLSWKAQLALALGGSLAISLGELAVAHLTCPAPEPP